MPPAAHYRGLLLPRPDCQGGRRDPAPPGLDRHPPPLRPRLHR